MQIITFFAHNYPDGQLQLPIRAITRSLPDHPALLFIANMRMHVCEGLKKLQRLEGRSELALPMQ